MEDYEGLDPQPYDADSRRRQSNRTAVIAGGAIVVIVVAAVGYWLSRPEPPPPPPPEPVVEAEPEPAEEPLPKLGEAAADEAFTPPPLDQSDDVVRQLITQVSARPDLTLALLPDAMVRRFVAGVVNVAEGVHPRPHMGVPVPEGELTVEEVEGVVHASPESYARYDPWVEAFTAFDPAGSAATYAKLEPLMDQAYRNLGYPNQRFDEALVAAISHLLATPIPVVRPALQPKVSSWVYVDPQLENLSPAQKQLLRMGPENLRRVHAHLRALAEALGVPAGRLPPTPIYSGDEE